MIYLGEYSKGRWYYAVTNSVADEFITMFGGEKGHFSPWGLEVFIPH